MSIFRSLIKLILRRGVRTSYAQFGEDLLIRPFLTKGKGFYVDVGCYHPFLYSNTYALYKRGWKGIVIDPNPGLRYLFYFFRPRDRFVEAGVGFLRTETYHLFSDGAYNTFDSILAQSYAKRSKPIGTRSVTIQPLSEILKGIESIDFLSVDVEGLDLEVLSSHDWKVCPKVISVETKPGSPVALFLEDKGYTVVGLTKLNMIFAHADVL